MNPTSAASSRPASAASVAQGNEALRNKQYDRAIACYLQAVYAAPAMASILAGNIEIARARYRLQRQADSRQRVAVCGWELSHNAAGRAYTLAKLYERFADVKLVGAIFPSFGTQVWEPLRHDRLICHAFIVKDHARFLEQAIALVASHPVDLVHLSKPRGPNILFGILYKLLWGATVLVDIDDEELSFVGSQSGVALDKYLAASGDRIALEGLDGKVWTEIAVGMADAFDGITVSNPALQKRYGGTIIRHARDEEKFKGSAQLRRASREKHDIAQDKIVVMFCGTPRKHKGLIEAADAITALGRSDLVFVIAGDFPDEALKQELQKRHAVDFKFLGNQRPDALPELLAMGDLALLFSDEQSAITAFQVPAKLSDALAMGFHVLATDSLALTEFANEPALKLIRSSDAPEALDIALRTMVGNVSAQHTARDLFLREFSFAANLPRLRGAVEAAFSRKEIDSRLNALMRALVRTRSEQAQGDAVECMLLSALLHDDSTLTSSPVPRPRMVDIVVPVFNALEDTKRCLEAVAYRTDGFTVSVYVVNDGSGEDTTAWLRQFCHAHPNFRLIEHSVNRGYTFAVNSGLRASRAPYVVTLNSDTIVTSGWLRSLVQCVESDPRLGVVGPLSNAASWQNVPALRDGNGNFAINDIPQGMTADEFAAFVRKYSSKRYPRLSFINGFCFLIRREVLDAIGFMDEATFPMGYGEENDFCVRAADAGFSFAVADDAYVFHAKSKSFGHERRTELSRKANDLLRQKHGADRFNSLLKRIGEEALQLDPIRRELADRIVQAGAACAAQSAPRCSRTNVTRVLTKDMHGVAVTLLPPPAYGTKDFEVDPSHFGPCLVLPYDMPDAVPALSPKALPSIGVHLHLFYADLATEFAYFLKNIPYPFTLYVSVVDEYSRATVEKRFMSDLPLARVVVEVHRNRGRDIAPFLVGFGKRLLRHDIICHIHSKRSPHNHAKADWRRQLVHNLLGSPALVAAAINILGESANIGMLFPEYHHSLRGQISWGTNYDICQKLASRLGIEINKEELALFPAGSMFWARKESLACLLNLPLTWEDFPDEAGQVDGTYAHAVERLLGEIVVAHGYELLQIKAEKQHSLMFYHPHKWPYRLPFGQDQMRRIVEDYRAAKPNRRARYAVYTAMTGGYDQPVFHEKLDERFDYLLYTDSLVNDRGFWEVRAIEYANERTVRRARHIKVNPHKYLQQYDVVVWIDANVVIRGELDKYVDFALAHPNVAFFGIPHAQRNCLYDEGESVVAGKKDTREQVDVQLNRYRREGFPKGQGLIETNFFVANLRHPDAAVLFAEWSAQIEAGSHRDQLSLNYVLWKHGVKWLPLFKEKITLRDSFDFAYLGHGKNSGYPSALEVPYSKMVSV
ncbi:hypothetical protein GCM10027343_01650 [Noviherbaspirillum agri]